MVNCTGGLANRNDCASPPLCPLERKTDMHTLTFNDKERALVIEILEVYLGRLPHEIH